MAAGYNLQEGTYKKGTLLDDELWSALSCLFSSRSKNSSSYKYGFLKALIDNLYNVDSELLLTFDQVFSKMAEIYWNLILKYELRQSSGRETSLEKILHEFVCGNKIPAGVPYETLDEDVQTIINQRVQQDCKRYVIGAVFEDTKQCFYSFSKKEKRIQFNPQMYDFICKHKIVIEKINYYEWARYLEKVNTDVSTIHLLTKIEESTKRENLSVFRHILYDEFEYDHCFYCGKKVSSRNSDIDHFIPWSFIKDDNIWNLVVSCSSCNRSKNDKLASTEFLFKLISRNRNILDIAEKAVIGNYREDGLVNIYHWAEANGYENIWEPK